MVEIVRTETVDGNGSLHLDLSGLEPGLRVEVILREASPKVYREPGGLEGKIRIAPDFDAPIPEMEPYA